MAQANEPDAWTEKFLISLQPKGGTATNYYAHITNYTVSGGDKDFTEIANGKGGRIKNFNPQTMIEVQLEGYFTEAGNTAGVYDYLHATTADSTQPLSFPADHSRELMLLSILHTTDTSATSAVAATTQDERAHRETYKNGHMTAVISDFGDSIKKFTITYKVTMFDKEATSNVTYESTDGSATSPLPSISYA